MSAPRRGSSRGARAALGVFALSLMVGVVALTGFFLGGGLEGGVPVTAVFSAPGVGQQLPVGGDVKVRGVLVGRIAAIDLDRGGRAVLELRLDEDVELPASSRAEIRSKTVFGQKWVELIPPRGDRSGELLVAGSVIPDARTREPLELERSLQLGHDLLTEIPLRDLAEVLQALAEGFSGQEGDAVTGIEQGLVALRAVNRRSAELDLSLRQLREVSEWLDGNDQELLEFLSALDRSNRALVGAAPEFRSSLESVPVFLDELTDFQLSSEDELARVIEDGATLAEILAAHSDDLTDIVVELRPFTTVWNSGLSQPCAGVFESDMTCWQLYLAPGMKSRGLYGPGEAPIADEPGDPLFGRYDGYVPRETSSASFLATGASEPAATLRGLLRAPLRGSGRIGSGP